MAFIEKRLLAQDLDRQDREQAREIAAPLTDPDPEARARAVHVIRLFGNKAMQALQKLEFAARPTSSDNRKLIEGALVEGIRYRRDTAAYEVLEQMATPAALDLLRKVAETLDDSPDNRNRKILARSAYESVEALKLRRPN